MREVPAAAAAPVCASPAGPSLPSAVLPKPAIAALETHGYCVVPSFLDPVGAARVQADALACEAAGLARQAGVGNRAHRTHQQREAVRKSIMMPLYPPPSPSAGSIDARIFLYDTVRRLCDDLNAARLSFAPRRLQPFLTELAYLYYPPGGYYRRHVDVPAQSGGWVRRGRREEDGGSFSGTELRRGVSFLLYLNAVPPLVRAHPRAAIAARTGLERRG